MFSFTTVLKNRHVINILNAYYRSHQAPIPYASYQPQTTASEHLLKTDSKHFWWFSAFVTSDVSYNKPAD